MDLPLEGISFQTIFLILDLFINAGKYLCAPVYNRFESATLSVHRMVKSLQGSCDMFNAILRVLFYVSMTLASSAVAASASSVDQPSFFHKFFTGKIDGKYVFSMSLKNVNGEVSGYYRYAKQSKDLFLTGSIDSIGNVKLEESYLGVPSGWFTGKIDGKTLIGKWTGSREGKSLEFQALQTSEILLASRRDTLSKAIGSYRLEAITANGGANVIWETTRKRSGWHSVVSSISLGTRAFSSIDLKASDIRMLNGINMRVRPDLSTQLLVDESVLVTIPYQQTVADCSGLACLSAEEMSDEALTLLSQDDVDYSSAIHGNFEALVSGTLSVHYSFVNKSFIVIFKNPEGWDSTRFTFSREAKGF